jgi:hypothetical protein
MPNMDQLTNQQTTKRAIQFNNDSDEDDSKKQKQLDIFKKRQIIKFSKN